MYPRGKRVNATLECLLYNLSLIAMSHTIQMCTCGVLKYASLIKRGNLTTIHQFHSLCVAVPAQNRSILSRETPTALNYGAIVSWLHAGFTIKSVLLQNISIKKCIFIHDISFINTVLLYVHRNTAVSRSPLAGSTNPLLAPRPQCSDVIMSAMASQIIGVSIVFSVVCAGADQGKQQSVVSLALMRGIHRWPVDSPKKRASNAENVSIWWRQHVISQASVWVSRTNSPHTFLLLRIVKHFLYRAIVWESHSLENYYLYFH